MIVYVINLLVLNSATCSFTIIVSLNHINDDENDVDRHLRNSSNGAAASIFPRGRRFFRGYVGGL